MKKIMIGCSVCQKPEILEAFLGSLKRLDTSKYEIQYCFIDDYEESASSELLQHFMNEYPGSLLLKSTLSHNDFIIDETTHHWDFDRTFKVGQMKNEILKKVLEENCDYFFQVDSDLLLWPQTLDKLVEADKDIISEVFWTKWYPDASALPQVWLYDLYDFCPKKYLGEKIEEQEANRRRIEWLNMLKVPGIYQVGGLGACTLISRKAIETGVNYNPISNYTIWGGDRWFCTRAACLGLELWAETSYPPYHIYRMSDLDGIDEFWKEVDYVLERNLEQC